MKIHIDKEKCDWYVSYFVDDHNHELVGEHYGWMIASNRSMTKIDAAQMNTMREVGIGKGKKICSFAGQSGGYRYIGFSKKDMYNQIERQRRIGNGDAESALQYLKEQSKSDSAIYMRNNEVVEDFKSSYGDELLQTPYHNLEGHAASIYTRVVFKEFREILLEAAKLRIISSQQTSSHVIYKIGKHYNPNKKWHVSHYDNGSNVDIKCSCRRIEYFGMSCSHSVFVLLILDISQLPSCLVLERWTKKAKNIEGVNFQQCELSRESVKTSRYGALSDSCRVLCNIACETEEDFSEMLKKVYNECSRLQSKQHSSLMENVDNATVD
ncbi:hypothetical protein Lal_00022841 [Lupinus albus]|nr:hypothetical protein Lal_00022841 [Lupinus albus]